MSSFVSRSSPIVALWLLTLIAAQCQQLTNAQEPTTEVIGDARQAQHTSYDASHRRQAARCSGARKEGDENCAMWRYKYIDEQVTDGFEVRVRDRSLDERLANSIYTAISIGVINMDFYKFNSGDAQLDADNLASVTPITTDDQLCNWQLTRMLELLKELESTRRPSGDNETMKRPAFDERHIRLGRVLDSYGRYESGLLLGKTHIMGQFDECTTGLLKLNYDNDDDDDDDDKPLVKTRYCWAHADLSKHMAPSLRARKVDRKFETSQYTLMVGACMPAACHTRSFMQSAGSGQLGRRNLELAKRLIWSQFQLPPAMFLEPTLELTDDLYCLVDSDSAYGMPVTGKLLLLFLAAWLALAFYATFFTPNQTTTTTTTNKKTDEPVARPPVAWLDCLNLKKSWQDFVGDSSSVETTNGQQSPRIVELDTLNPIKAFGAAFVVIGHSLIIQAVTSNDRLRAYNQIENDPVVLSMIVGTVVVDTFFVITGILMAYIAMRKSVKSSSSSSSSSSASSASSAAAAKTTIVSKVTITNVDGNSVQQSNGTHNSSATKTRDSIITMFTKQWLKVAISRYLRLVPLFSLVWAFKRYVLIYSAGRGLPLWDNGFNKDTLFGACKQEPWWSPLTLASAFLPLSKQCLPQSWSISVDMFVSALIAPLVLIMIKKPKLALLLGSIIGLLSYVATVNVYLNMPEVMMSELSQLRTHGFVFMFGPLHYLYTYPQYRFPQILIGLVFGYMLHVYQEAGEKRQWPAWLRGPATVSSIQSIISLFVIIAILPHIKHYLAPHEQQIYTHLFTTGRIIWALSNAIIFIRMTTDWRQTFLMRQFASKYWSTLVRLNLAILLIHMDLLIYHMGSMTSLTYFSKLYVFNLFGATYMGCLLLATFLHVVYENPIDKLVRRHVMPHIFS